jgi:hypothetical protein
MHNLLKQKIREIDLDRDRNLRGFDMKADKNIKIEEKTHVQRGPSSRIGQKTRKGKSGARIVNEKFQVSGRLFHFRCQGEVFDLLSIGFSKERPSF